MRCLALILLLSGCAPMPTYELVGCPASQGWTQRDRDALLWEEIQPDFKQRYPHIAQALIEYENIRPDRCLLLSGLREYP
jgi:hypothetical protein